MTETLLLSLVIITLLINFVCIILYLLKCTNLQKYLQEHEIELWHNHGKPSISFSEDSMKRSFSLFKFIHNKHYMDLISEEARIIGKHAHHLFHISFYLFAILILLVITLLMMFPGQSY